MTGWTRRRVVMSLFVVLPLALLGLVAMGGCDGGSDGGGGDGAGASAGGSGAGGEITILWAQWPPANHLEEMGKDYEAKTGTAVRVVQKSWSGAFGEAKEQEFKTAGTTYDIIIGDSQWIGQGAKGGHYLELTDFIKENQPLFADYAPRAMTYYCEYPKESGKYYAVPGEGDAMAFAYRKDLFEDPAHKAKFAEYLKANNQAAFELGVPETWEQLLWIAKYFKEASGLLNMAGIVMPTSRNYDQMTMSFQNVLWAFGGEYGSVEDVKFNSSETIEAMSFFQQLLGATSEAGKNMDYGEVSSAYISGNAAMCCTYMAFFPQIASEEENKNFASKTGYFNVPKGPRGRAASLGGQGMSINAHISPDRQQRAKEFLKWFCAEETQRQWVQGSGCFTTHTKVLQSDAVKNNPAMPYAKLFDEAFGMVNDFWSIPEYDQLLTVFQSQLAGVFQDGSIQPEAAAKTIEEEWERILKASGYGASAPAAQAE